MTPTAAVTHDDLHPDGEYSTTAKCFHWLTVPALVVLLASGAIIRFVADESKMRFYTVHESLGVLVLLLALARLAWRLRTPPPPMSPTISASERAAASAVHTLLYALLVVQPVLGFFTTNAYGFPQRGATAFLGFIDLPAFMEAAPDLARTLHTAHGVVGGALALLIVTHIVGVLHRHIVYGDGTLLRML